MPEFEDWVNKCSDCGTPLAAGPKPKPSDRPDDLSQVPIPGVRYRAIATFQTPHLAHLAKSRLASEDIHSVVRDEYIVTMNWLLSNAIGGVKLLVGEKDVEESIRLLAAEETVDLSGEEANELAGTGDGCIQCGSRNVAFRQRQRKAAALTLLTGLPFLFFGKRYRCRSCGHAWTPAEETGAEIAG